VCAVGVGLVALWALRLPETLDEADRLPLQASRLLAAAKAVVDEPRTMWPALAMTALYGVFTSWIASSELIIGDVFGRGAQFPLVFGGLAAALGVGMLVNARVVDHVGTRTVTRWATAGYVAASAVFAVLAVAFDGVPPFWAFATVLAVVLGAHALLVPNINSLAMEHVGHVAGTASSVIGALQIAGGALLGSVLDRMLDGSVTPLAVGFLGYGVLCALLLRRSGVLRPT
jgi:DHA1 family bicyclomycin/chloramphenicol resistance-like MFS transporter